MKKCWNAIEIIARELNMEVETEHAAKNPYALPPPAKMEDFEMITEGIFTLGKVEEIPESYNSDTRLQDSPRSR